MLLLTSHYVFAQGVPNAADMINSSKASVSSLIDVLGSVAWIVGLMFSIFGVFTLVKVSAGKAELKHALWMLVAAGFLLNIQMFYSIVAGTTDSGFAEVSGNMRDILKAPSVAGGSFGSFNEALGGVLLYVKLIGMLAFVKGIMLLNAHAKEKDGAFGKSLTHIFGGSLAMNIEWTITMLSTTMGYPLGSLLGLG